MKILRYRKDGKVKPGILDHDEKIRDASSLVKDWDNQNITIDNLNKISSKDLSSLPVIETTDSGLTFSTSLKKLLLFSVTHWVSPK